MAQILPTHLPCNLLHPTIDDIEYSSAEKQRQKDVQAVMDLFYALKEIKGTPTLKDLVKLAKRIKNG